MKKFLAVILLLSAVNFAEALPSRYDLRDYGHVSSVKDQGSFSACGTFAVLGAMESNYLTQGLGGKAPDLSEMHAACYAYNSLEKEKNFADNFRYELFATTAFCARLAGPANESSMKYDSKKIKGFKAKQSPESYKRAMRLREAYFLSDINPVVDETVKKNLIINHGAIVAGFFSDKKKYHRAGNYYTYFNNERKKQISHEVLLIGWDDNFSRDNFSPKPSRDGAWLAKNSWGTGWGSKGYFWMSYDQYLARGTAFIVEKDNPDLRHYGYDDLGLCNTLSKTSWCANIFRIREAQEFLKEAAFYTARNDTEYELYIYSSGENFPKLPTDGKLLAKLQGRKELAGYYTVNLPEKILMKQGEYFSVVLKLSPDFMPIETKRLSYSENAVTHEHESYFSKSGKSWTDGINILEGSNACVKAFTVVK